MRHHRGVSQRRRSGDGPGFALLRRAWVLGVMGQGVDPPSQGESQHPTPTGGGPETLPGLA